MTLNLIFPHQLFASSKLIDNEYPVYLIEEYLFFNQYKFHKQKLAFHRASMRAYQAYLEGNGKTVVYISATEEQSDIRQLIPQLAKKNVQQLHYIDPVDNYLGKRIRAGADQYEMQLVCYPTDLFLNTPEDLQPFFRKDKKKFFQTSFYIEQRKKRDILIDGPDEPAGGKWSFDHENRKKYPRKKEAPSIEYPTLNEYYKEAIQYVSTHYKDNPGELTASPLYPIDFKTSQAWLNQFLKKRFAEFGTYEDAIVQKESILNHSVLTPMLNVGLLLPQEIIDKSLAFAESHNIPINSTEGFVRQIIGWREFIRGIYESKGVAQRTKNYWGFTRKLPKSFYDGSTGIPIFDDTIKKVLKTGYCHHIERLMVLGNFMLLCEIDPDEVYRWFMELFIDAYDWVMVPNVYGMSQFADGGFMATKPYISGSNYLRKMSDVKKGDWQDIWDALFWRFMHVHRDFFSSNPR